MNLQRFSAFSILHLATVIGLAGLIAVLCLVGYRLRATPYLRTYERALALGVAALWIGYQVYDGMSSGWSPAHSLPLQLCDLAAGIAALTFAAPQRWRHALAWFWGIGLSTQAVITPDLTSGPATLAYWAFWLYHAFVVGAGVYVVTVRGFRPAWRDLQFAVGVGVVYSVVVFAIDVIFGLNYGYLGPSQPGMPSLLDFLGPWPLRVVFVVVIGAVAMWLCWIPWQLAAVRRRSPRSPGD